MPPAARLCDLHICPAASGPVPHVGGPVGPVVSVTTVLIGGLPAATAGSPAVCTGPPDAIAMGSRSVLIQGQPAARMGDPTTHGGKVAAGQLNVLIGDGGGASAAGAGASDLGAVASALAAAADANPASQTRDQALVEAAAEGVALVEPCDHPEESE